MPRAAICTPDVRSASRTSSLVDALPAQLGLKKTVKATLANPSATAQAIPTIDASPLLKLDVGQMAATAKPSLNKSTSLLTDGTVAQLGQLLNLKVPGASATTLLSALQGQVDDVSGTVTDQVDSAVV